MKEITGIIDHRILLNFRIDPAVIKNILPDEFTPKLVNGYAIAGICQVSLSQMRFKGMPSILGTRSHNAAHRIAVHTPQGEGVYVPRRDTNSWFNRISGGRLFPGVYSKALFEVKDFKNRYNVRIDSGDNKLLMSIDAEIVSDFPKDSVFGSIQEISEFFKTGTIGWSPKKITNQFDAIELQSHKWHMQPLKVLTSYSSYFSDTSNFPEGSVTFDSAMIMKNLRHSWVIRENLCGLSC